MSLIHRFAKMAAVTLVAGLVTGASHAATVSCSSLVPDATNSLTPNSGCQAYSSPSDPNPANFDGLFNQNDWTELAKIDAGNITGSSSVTSNGGTFTFTSTNNNTSGTWSVSGFLYEALAIVLKDGNQAPAPTLIYLVSLGQGIWTTPWVNNGISIASLSNVQLWGAVPAPIPLPAALPLLGGALGGLGLFSWRRRRKGKANLMVIPA